MLAAAQLQEGGIIPQSLKLLEEVAAPCFCCGPGALSAPSDSHLAGEKQPGTTCSLLLEAGKYKVTLRLSLCHFLPHTLQEKC